MKNLIITAGIIISVFGLLSFRTGYVPSSGTAMKSNVDHETKFVVPDHVKAILDKSCLPCHGAAGSGKAKMKWNYIKTADMKPSRMVGKLSKIVSKVEKDKMPPPKYVANHTDVKISGEEKGVLIDWANKLIKDLMHE